MPIFVVVAVVVHDFVGSIVPAISDFHPTALLAAAAVVSVAVVVVEVVPPLLVALPMRLTTFVAGFHSMRCAVHSIGRLLLGLHLLLLRRQAIGPAIEVVLHSWSAAVANSFDRRTALRLPDSAFAARRRPADWCVVAVVAAAVAAVAAEQHSATAIAQSKRPTMDCRHPAVVVVAVVGSELYATKSDWR